MTTDKITRLKAQYGAYATLRPLGSWSNAYSYVRVEIPGPNGRGYRTIGYGDEASRSDAYSTAWRDAVEWAEKHGWPAVLPEQ